MAFSTPLFLAVCLGTALLCAAGPSGAFRGSSGAGAAAVVSTAEVETSLQEVFQAMTRGRGASATELARIEASVWQTFQSLPKNAAGRLLPPAVRYLVHHYFAKEHGWMILGLEQKAAGPNVSEPHGNANIIRDRAPAFVEALLESRRMGAGLALDDVVAMVATIEHLVLHEAVSFLEASYRLNSVSSLQSLDQDGVEDVLLSYLTLFGQGSKADLTNEVRHQKVKAHLIANASDSWTPMVAHTRDAVLNYNYVRKDLNNPFEPPRYSFEMAVELAQGLAHGYGKWQNKECVDMKDALLSRAPEGTGRVPLKNFYAGNFGKTWHFSESADMLRQLGALDETANGGPQVLIPNYMAQPANCIATSAYYTVCCLNECGAVMDEVEQAVQAPAASADRLLGIVGNISTATVDAPRVLPRALAQKLREVEASQGGDVALHGRLFMQWLHFAFPNECAYPATEEANVITAQEWIAADRQVDEITAEERQRHVAAEAADREAAHAAAAAALVPQPQDEAGETEEDDEGTCSLKAWSDEERYHVHEDSTRFQPSPVQRAPRGSSSRFQASSVEDAPRPSAARRVLRLVAQLAALAVVARTAYIFLGAGGRTKAGHGSDRWSDPKAWSGREAREQGLSLPF